MFIDFHGFSWNFIGLRGSWARITEVRDEQRRNADFPMLNKPSPRTTDVSFEQLMNAPSSMDVTPSFGRTREVRPDRMNAPRLMVRTLGGMLTVASFSQSASASSGIVSTPSGMFMDKTVARSPLNMKTVGGWELCGRMGER